MGVRLAAALLGAAFCCAAQNLPEGPLPEGLGKDLVEAICTSCHDLNRVVAKQLTKSDWQAKVLEMLQEEPDVTQPERDRIVEYLAKNFPRKVNVNTAQAQDIASVLELPPKDAEAIVRYREAKGSFHGIDDLKKVPGIESAKIETVRERLEFSETR